MAKTSWRKFRLIDRHRADGKSESGNRGGEAKGAKSGHGR